MSGIEKILYGIPKLLNFIDKKSYGANCSDGGSASEGGGTNGNGADGLECDGGGTPDGNTVLAGLGCASGTDPGVLCNTGTEGGGCYGGGGD
ncbi:MAG: hypothetical protein HQ564_04405 [Candidatus Saganbacteria bacterium]|nr:hypothetical protein [Candidatus Saganbacteria bacterium]